MSKREELINKIVEKYEALGENPDTYLEGLLHQSPIEYWDYIQVESLLSLQKPVTNFEDEVVFIGYHQITELTLKLMIHEIKQLVFNDIDEATFSDKLGRLTRYTDLLITSFSVMKNGMSYEDYNTFRMSLAPASGFQSAQFRFLEIYCTPILNLVNEKGKERLSSKPSLDELFKNIYWRDAGYNRKTGESNQTLSVFEKKYLKEFKALAKEVEGKTLNEQLMRIEQPSEKLIKSVKDFDYNYNVKWPLTHLATASKYLNSKGENKAATGGSEWQKYLHPKYQQRKFFPQLWHDNSILNWKK